jgi:cell division protein FtsB
MIQIFFWLQSDIEASLRDAHSTIAELERQVATLRRQKSEESHATKETQDLRKQLDVMKDRNTALEQQMMEYSTTVQDQAKVGFFP